MSRYVPKQKPRKKTRPRYDPRRPENILAGYQRLMSFIWRDRPLVLKRRGYREAAR